MKSVFRFAVGMTVLFVTAHCVAQTADSVYRNGRIYTVDGAQPWAQALAIAGKRLIYVGDDASAQKYVGSKTKVIDLQGRMVMPGIHDAHTHLLWAGIQLNYACQFGSDVSFDKILAKLRECEKDLAADEWLVAGLFLFNQFPDNKPHKSLLDEAFPNRPVYLREGSFHHALLNTKALELAGIDKNTLAPFGGEIRKDANGELTGELVETATVLVQSYLPTTSAELNLAAMRWANAINNQYGITSVQDASSHQLTLEALSALEREGALTLRIAAHLIWGSPKFGDTTNEGLEALIDARKNMRPSTSMWISLKFGWTVRRRSHTSPRQMSMHRTTNWNSNACSFHPRHLTRQSCASTRWE